jgi:hypothetical protein
MNDTVQCLLDKGLIEEGDAQTLSDILNALPYSERDLLALLVALRIKELIPS